MHSFLHYRWLLLAGALSGVLLAFGCGARPGNSGETLKKTYYFDAELQFAIEIPSTWRLSRSDGQAPESCTVHWQDATPAGNGEPAAQATVFACPATRWPTGADAMRTELLTAHPGLTLGPREELDSSAGEAEILEGHDASRHYLVTLLPTEERGYIVILSAAVGSFEEIRPLFEEILASFEPVATD